MTEIKGARVLVTGGQRGLGKAFAAALLEAGAETCTSPRAAPSRRRTRGWCRWPWR